MSDSPEGTSAESASEASVADVPGGHGGADIGDLFSANEVGADIDPSSPTPKTSNGERPQPKRDALSKGQEIADSINAQVAALDAKPEEEVVEGQEVPTGEQVAAPEAGAPPAPETMEEKVATRVTSQIAPAFKQLADLVGVLVQSNQQEAQIRMETMNIHRQRQHQAEQQKFQEAQQQQWEAMRPKRPSPDATATEWSQYADDVAAFSEKRSIATMEQRFTSLEQRMEQRAQQEQQVRNAQVQQEQEKYVVDQVERLAADARYPFMKNAETQQFFLEKWWAMNAAAGKRLPPEQVADSLARAMGVAKPAAQAAQVRSAKGQVAEANRTAQKKNLPTLRGGQRNSQSSDQIIKETNRQKRPHWADDDTVFGTH